MYLTVKNSSISFAVLIPEMHVPSIPTPSRGGPLSSRGTPGFGNYGPGFSPGTGLQTSRARASYLGFPAVNDGKTVEPAVVIAQDKLQELTSDVRSKHTSLYLSNRCLDFLIVVVAQLSSKIYPNRILALFIRCI